MREQIPLDPQPARGQDAVLLEFLTAVSEGRQPECNGRDNPRSLALVFAAVKSAKENREVDIAELLG